MMRQIAESLIVTFVIPACGAAFAPSPPCYRFPAPKLLILLAYPRYQQFHRPAFETFHHNAGFNEQPFWLFRHLSGPSNI